METISVTKSRFKHSGLYNLSSYYNVLYDTLRVLGYDVEEVKYRNKIGPDGQTVEIELFWDAKRKIDDYSKMFIYAKTLIVGMSKQQTQIDGKPVTKDKGIAELELKARVEVDYQNKWEANPIMQQLRWWFEKYFYHDKLNFIQSKVAADMNKLENEIKAFFNMQTFL